MGLGGRETPSDALVVAPVAAVEIIKNKQFSVLLGARLIPLSSTVTFQQHSHFINSDSLKQPKICLFPVCKWCNRNSGE